MRGYWKTFGKWQFYFHYVLLAVFVSLVAVYFDAPFDFKMFMILLGTLFFGDVLIHSVFYYLPKPPRWRD